MLSQYMPAVGIASDAVQLSVKAGVRKINDSYFVKLII